MQKKNEDPVLSLMNLIQKLAKIYNSKILDSEEKFWTDLFYEKTILNENKLVK